jgi:hypothetical protein
MLTKITVTFALGDGVTPDRARQILRWLEEGARAHKETLETADLLEPGEVLMGPALLTFTAPARAQDRAPIIKTRRPAPKPPIKAPDPV